MNELNYDVIRIFENSISNITGQKLTNVIQDLECYEYAGYDFQIDHHNLKFRKAKITPKKLDNL